MLIYFTLLILFFPFFFASASLPSSPVLNVKIADKLKVVDITGIDLERKIFFPEEKERVHSGRKTLRFNCHSHKNLSLDGSLLVASINSPTQVLTWNKNLYRGDFNLAVEKNKKGCSLIHRVSLENYISSLLAKEMNAVWPIESLKAQAIAARTYAVIKMRENESSEKPYHLLNSEIHQVTGHLLDETLRTVKAARETQGEVLVLKKNQQLAPVFYSAKCGGKTHLAENIWGNRVPGQASVICPYCHNHGKKKWESKVSINEVRRIIKKTTEPNLTNIVFPPDNLTSEDLYYYSKGELKHIKKSSLRRHLGRKKIVSNNFSIIATDKKNITLQGSGLGHGVGLCQLGALEMAKRGIKAEEILSFYFPLHEIKKIY